MSSNINADFYTIHSCSVGVKQATSASDDVDDALTRFSRLWFIHSTFSFSLLPFCSVLSCLALPHTMHTQHDRSSHPRYMEGELPRESFLSEGPLWLDSWIPLQLDALVHQFAKYRCMHIWCHNRLNNGLLATNWSIEMTVCTLLSQWMPISFNYQLRSLRCDHQAWCSAWLVPFPNHCNIVLGFRLALLCNLHSSVFFELCWSRPVHVEHLR